LPDAPAQHQSDSGAPDAGQNQTTQRPLSLLARDAFGSNFHGEVQEEPKGPLSEGDPNASQQQDEPADDDTPAPQGDTDNKDDADTGGGDTPDADADKGDDVDEGEVRTVSELIQSLETDPDWFQGLEVDVTVNGKASQVPFRELVANYQMNQAAEARLEQAKTKSQEAQQMLAHKNAALEAQFATAGAIIEQAEKVLTAEFEGVDWNTLHEEDPAVWSAEKVKFSERQQQLQALKSHLVQHYQQSVNQRQQEFQQRQGEYLVEQGQKLQEAMPKVNPDWGSADKLPTMKAKLTDFLLNQGFTQEDINTAADHRLLVIAEKARLYDEAKGKVDVTKKRLRKVPKMIKPGTPKAPSQVNQEQVAQQQRRLRSSGSIDDAVALLRAKRKA